MGNIVSDMDEHGKMKADMKTVIKEVMDAFAAKDDKVISGHIKRRCDEKFGPTWHCIVGEDFKAAIGHESKHFFYATLGKTNVLVYRCG